MSRAKLPLQGLYCFYLAAEIGSFKAAAEQMSVSAAAMSQQIRQLEDRLSVKLFIRQHRQVRLTPAGLSLHHYVRHGFGALQEGLHALDADPDPTTLTLSVVPSFAQRWLVPRLVSFTELQPDLSVLMTSSVALVDFQLDRVDLCVRFGPGRYSGLQSEFLMSDHIYPVCHPLYLEQNPIGSLADLAKVQLIEDVWPDMNWNYWLELAGITVPKVKVAMRYPGAHVVLEGALAVQGVALVRHSLAWKYIQQGLLTRIGQIEVCSAYSYYLVAPPAHFKRDKIRQFSDWLHVEATDFWQASQLEMGNNRNILQAIGPIP